MIIITSAMARHLMLVMGVALSIGLLLMLVLVSVLGIRKPFIKSLRGKHVFVTGASSGIGLAVAKQCLLDGAFVTIVSRSSTNLKNAVQKLLKETECEPDKLKPQVADVGDYNLIVNAVKEALQWRPIDVLVCNAGLTRGSYLDQCSVEDIDMVIRTNLNGTIYPVHEALPSLKEHSANHPVSIVILCSMASLFFMYGHPVYTATKYALRGFAECLRVDLMPFKNMRVTVMCPGFVETPFLDDLYNKGEITEILRKVCLLSKWFLEKPEYTAALMVEALKHGSFLVLTQKVGFHVMTLGRGLMPAESPGRYLLELVLLVPSRIASIFIAIFIKHTIVNTVRKYKKA